MTPVSSHRSERCVDPLTVIALTSRGWMYLLLFLSADIGFSTWVVSSLLMTIDGLASGRRVLLYLGIVLQTVAWPAMASEDLLWTESQTSTTLLIPITQCLALIYMAWKGSDLVGKFHSPSTGRRSVSMPVPCHSWWAMLLIRRISASIPPTSIGGLWPPFTRWLLNG